MFEAGYVAFGVGLLVVGDADYYEFGVGFVELFVVEFLVCYCVWLEVFYYYVGCGCEFVHALLVVLVV